MSKIVLIGNSKSSVNLSSYLKSIRINHRIIPYRKSKFQKDKIKKAEVIFILTKDDEIEKFYNKNKDILISKKLFHFSGAVTHKHIISIHPVFSFSKKTISKEEFEKIIFSSENPGYIKKNLKWFKNKVIKINPQEKAYYHSLLSVYFNFPLIIIRELSDRITRKFNISKNYLKYSFIKNFERYIKTDEITGPIERNDKKTIKKHMKSLKNKRILSLYKEILKLARRRYEYNWFL